MNMNIDFYPYNEPQIMTDNIFISFGGSIENTSKAQRNSVFVMAEYALYTDLDTFLLVTRVTGTYTYSNKIQLQHSYVNQVHLVQFLKYDDTIYYTITGTQTQYMKLVNQEFGSLELYDACLYACGSCYYEGPTRLRIVYDAGFGSGACYNPNILQALTTYSTILMNEIIGWGNEAPGDIGVKQFSNQEYTETRKFLLNTSYGQSPKANFVHRLLARFRKRRFGGL